MARCGWRAHDTAPLNSPLITVEGSQSFIATVNIDLTKSAGTMTGGFVVFQQIVIKQPDD